MTRDYLFKVEIGKCGQERSYGDSFYNFKVTSDRSEHEVKMFCMNVLHKGYKKEDMPNPFAGEVLVFQKLTNNNGDKPDFLSVNKEETYKYRVRELFTD